VCNSGFHFNHCVIKATAKTLKTCTRQATALGVVTFLSLSYLSLGFLSNVHAASGEFRVVLDPGHGGSDHGAEVRLPSRETVDRAGQSPWVSEKTLTLLLAKKVAAKLQAHGVVALLTRSQDEDVNLASRTALANQLQAQLFISIHLNSTPQRTLSQLNSEGIETYILNQTTDASSRRLAQLENSVLGESRGLTPDPSVAMILKDLRLEANRSASRTLACSLQKRVSVQTLQWKRRQLTQSHPHLFPHATKKIVQNRGIKEALFHVLLGADMPGVLLEAGFLTHPRDRALLLSPEGQDVLATAIAQAILDYRQEYLRALPHLPKLKKASDTCPMSRQA
jgi:N-acetylmuramoyl-L-alanine amidase